MQTVIEAMATMDVFYKPGSRPQRNNNPLDLTYCSESEAFGATHGDPRFAVFPDVATGWNAARRWLSVPAKFGKDAQGNPVLIGGYLNATIEQAINRFAPPVENDTSNYVSYVCSQTGLTPESVLTVDNLG